MFDLNSLIVTSLASLVGMGYFMYGKKAGELDFLAFGAALMLYPYFVDSLWLAVSIGAALIAAPFLWRRYG